MPTPPTPPAEPSFHNLGELTTYQREVKADFIEACRVLIDMIRTESNHLVAAHAHDLNCFDFSKSWKSPQSELLELNSALQSLYHHATTAFNSITCGSIHAPPIAIEQNKQWINGLQSEPETTEQTAAETEPALSQSA